MASNSPLAARICLNFAKLNLHSHPRSVRAQAWAVDCRMPALASGLAPLLLSRVSWRLSFLYGMFVPVCLGLAGVSSAGCNPVKLFGGKRDGGDGVTSGSAAVPAATE